MHLRLIYFKIVIQEHLLSTSYIRHCFSCQNGKMNKDALQKLTINKLLLKWRYEQNRYTCDTCSLEVRIHGSGDTWTESSRIRGGGRTLHQRQQLLPKCTRDILEKGTSFGNIGRVLMWYLLMSLYEMNYNNLN